MTTAYEVMTELAMQAETACYPNGTSSAGVVSSDIKIVTGWPLPQDLNDSMEAGKSQVSVFTLPSERDTTRYNVDWREVTRPSPTITAVVAGQVLTLGGTISAGNIVAALIDRGLYAYVVLLGDTLTSITAALLALIQVDLPGATATGPAITVPATSQILSVQTGAPGTAIRNLRQTERQFQVTVWSPSLGDRDAIATAIERWLATLTTDPERVISFLTMPDGTQARIKYQRANISDDMQKVRVYRHYLYYLVDYSLTATATFAPTLLNVREDLRS